MSGYQCHFLNLKFKCVKFNFPLGFVENFYYKEFYYYMRYSTSSIPKFKRINFNGLKSQIYYTKMNHKIIIDSNFEYPYILFIYCIIVYEGFRKFLQ